MSEIRKEQERDELHRAIWAIADELRGAVDGWDFKIYVLGTMFYRYLSENLTNYINKGQHEAGLDDFDYAKLPDEIAERERDALINEKGFFIPPSQLFCNLVKRASDDENLNLTIKNIFDNIEEAAGQNPAGGNYKGLFADFVTNSNKLIAAEGKGPDNSRPVAAINKRLAKLLNGVAEMKLSQNADDHQNDTFGDAYEYLMGMYASSAGKSGGEFFTPSDVSTLLARLGTFGKTKIQRAYDPACGSGSLLLKVEKVLGKGAVDRFFGQEINNTTYNLCRINMFMHDIGYSDFRIANDDTLMSPHIWDKGGNEVLFNPEVPLKEKESFDLIVSNPPYSIKWNNDDDPTLINDVRYRPAGVLAPKSKADLAFVMHCLSWLSGDGAAAIVCFPGVMYRGGAEGKIRKYLVDESHIDCIVQLPPNLFYGTSIATCIMVLKKGKPDNSVLFIDASREFVKVTNNNRLTPENIEKIVAAYANRENEKGFSHLATYDEIVKNDYNLSVSTYVETDEEREEVDIAKHNAEIKEIVVREQKLRDEIDAIIEEIENAG